MQTLLDQLNTLIGQTWFWVVTALALMYFLTCYTRESFQSKEGKLGTLDAELGQSMEDLKSKQKKKTITALQ